MGPQEDSLFFIDRGFAGAAADRCADDGAGVALAESGAAWNDEEDAQGVVRLDQQVCRAGVRESKRETAITAEEYQRRLRTKFMHQQPKPSWASVPHDVAESLMSQDPFSIISRGSRLEQSPLLPDVISMRRFRNLLLPGSAKSGISCLDFHPRMPWLLAARKTGECAVFQLEGAENKLLFSFKTGGHIVHSARFTADGDRVLLCGNGPGLVVWHITEGRIERIRSISGRKEKQWKGMEISPCGRFVALLGDHGAVVVLSGTSLRPVGALKMNGESLCCAFNASGSILFTSGTERKIYVWETKSFRCVRFVNDDAGAAVSSLAVSADEQQLFAGSALGILNMYSLPSLIGPHGSPVKPTKALLNLTTQISTISVHPSSELVAYSSTERSRAFRFVHLQTARVFANWPKDNSPLFKVSHSAFDPSGRYLAIGNDKGHVLLYGIRHYEFSE